MSPIHGYSTGGGGGGGVTVPAWRSGLTAGIVLQTLLRDLATEAAGIVVAQSPTRAKVQSAAGAVITTRVPNATVKPVQLAGFVMATTPTTPTGVPPTREAAGSRVLRHTISLIRRIGATTEAQSGVVGSGFVNPANAQGLHDGVFAVLTGSAVAAQGGTLTGTYTDADSTKPTLTISSVKLYLYWKVTGDTLSSSVVTRSYSSTGGLASTPLGASSSGTVDHSVTPEVFDITAAVGGSWAKLAGFSTVFTGSTPPANVAVISLDAIELEIATATLVTAQ